MAIVAAGLLTASAPVVAFAQGASVTEATPEQKSRAQDLYQKGVAAFERGRFDEAIAQFQESFGVVKSPNTRFMIARSLSERGDKSGAYNELRLVEEDAARAGDRYEDTRSRAAELRATLAADVGMLTVRVILADDSDPVIVKLDGKEIPRKDWGRPFAVAPGTRELVLTYAGGVRARRGLEFEPGRPQEVEFDSSTDAVVVDSGPGVSPLTGPAPSRRSSADKKSSGLVPAAAVAGGLGAGGLAMFAVFGSLNASTFESVELACPDRQCPPSQREQLEDDIDRGRTQQTIANVALIVGLVGVTTAATLVVIELASDDDSSEASNLRLTAGPTGVGLAGRF